MNKLLLITAFIFSFQFGKSQTYIPFVEDSMIVVNQGLRQLYIYKYIGDTTIGGIIYKRVYKNSDFVDSSFVINSNHIYFGDIRENSRKIYFVFKDSAVEKKIYDLSMNVGDSTYLYYHKVNKYLKVKLLDNDSLFCDTTGRLWYEIDSLFGYLDFTSYFINGFGHDVPYYDLENRLTTRLCVYRKSKNHVKCHNHSYLECMRSSYIKENKLIKNIKLYPNPSKDKISLENTANKQINKVKIFAISGKLIKDVSFKNQKNKETISVKELPNGIYFMQVLVEDSLVTLKFLKE